MSFKQQRTTWKKKDNIKQQLASIRFTNKLKMKTAFKITAHENSNQLKVTIQGNTLEKWIPANRRAGKPRRNWAETTVAEIWEELRQHNTRFRFTSFDYNNPHKVRAFEQYAKESTAQTTTQHTSNTQHFLPPPFSIFQPQRG